LAGAHVGRAIEPRNGSHSGVPMLSERRKATLSAALARAVGGPRAWKNPCMRGVSMRENREVPRSPARRITGGPLREGHGCTPEMNERGKSDSPVGAPG
jgi:hypothetical protein